HFEYIRGAAALPTAGPEEFPGPKTPAARGSDSAGRNNADGVPKLIGRSHSSDTGRTGRRYACAAGTRPAGPWARAGRPRPGGPGDRTPSHASAASVRPMVWSDSICLRARPHTTAGLHRKVHAIRRRALSERPGATGRAHRPYSQHRPPVFASHLSITTRRTAAEKKDRTGCPCPVEDSDR